MTPYPVQLCSLVESRLPLTVESDGGEDDWNVVGAATVVAAAVHLRTIVHLQETLPSGVIVWQLVRSLFEYVATYAWVAADPASRAEQWLKSDYVQRLKLDNDFRELGQPLLDGADRERVVDFRPEASEMPGSLIDRAKTSDRAWLEQFKLLDGYLPDENRSFRALYPLIYRNGSQFTHPSSHALARFVTGDPPWLTIGAEKPLTRDLGLVGSGILALGLAVAVTSTPAFGLTIDEIQAALS